MSAKHKAVYGMTQMGKTWLMKRRAKILAQKKQKILVYSGVGDIEWPKSAKVTMEAEILEYWLGQKENERAFVFLDEAAILIDEASKRKDFPNIHRLLQAGRHKGFTCFLATQYPTSIPLKWRTNCDETYCFRLGDEESAKLVWADNSRKKINDKPMYKEILELKKLEFIHIIKPDYIEKKTL